MRYLNDFISLFFPRICYGCGESLISNERIICTACHLNLPRTNFHTQIDNPINKVFWGRVDIESAAALFFYAKGGNVQHLIHQLKYKDHKEVGVYLGEMLGNDILESAIFERIDLIIPIPLHPKKLRKRGFNQAEIFATGISNSMSIDVDIKSVIRTVDTATQTKKGRYKRWENVNEIFAITDPEQIQGKHILLVDDVITTGATMEACIQTLKSVQGVKVSVGSIAYASN